MPAADLEQLEWFRFRKRRAKAIIVIGLAIGFGTRVGAPGSL
jgi:hypothetical protein